MSQQEDDKIAIFFFIVSENLSTSLLSLFLFLHFFYFYLFVYNAKRQKVLLFLLYYE